MLPPKQERSESALARPADPGNGEGRDLRLVDATRPDLDAGEGDYNLQILQPLLNFVRNKHGQPAMQSLVADAGLPPNVFDRPEYWVTHPQFEQLLSGARTLVDSDEAFMRACAFELGSVYGPVLLVLRAMTVRLAFQAMARTSYLVCRKSRFQVVAGTRTSVRFRYTTSHPETRLMCLSRQAQHRAIPTLWWGIPPAKLDEHSCIAHGDEACEYTIRWYEPLRLRSAGLGALVGALAAGLLPASVAQAPAAFILFSLLGLCTGLGLELRRMLVDHRSFAQETSLDIEHMVRGHSAAVEELLALHHRERAWSERLESTIHDLTSRMDLVVGKLKHSGDGHREKLRSLSHDIGNPLMVLSATLTFMQSNTTRTAEDNEALQALERASCRVSRLVDELVAILGDESQVPAIPIETIQLEDLSQRIRGQLQATVRGRDIRVTLFKTREAPVSIETYPLLLERVIDNIITNACKYTERGSIIVEVGGTPGYLLLKISDTGRGMGSERLEEVFLRGSPDAKPVVGTSHGLGLSIVVRLLDQMNGRLEIMSNPGLGTTMWLYIPSKITSGRSTHQDESTKEQFQRVVRIRPRP